MIIKYFYEFTYDGRTRRVLVIASKGQNKYLCWDFTIQGYRTFDVRKIGKARPIKGFVTSKLDMKFKHETIETFVCDNQLYAMDVPESLVRYF